MSKRRKDLIDKMIAIETNKNIGFLEMIDEKYKLFSIMLSDEGWYFDYELALETLSDLYIDQVFNDSDVLDEYMIKFYRDKIKDIIDNFKTIQNKRYPIIEKAFIAHDMGYYELSIPVFLAQIEGVFFDLTKKDLFSQGRRNNKENTAGNWIDLKSSSDIDNNLQFRLTLLGSLKNNENITANFTESNDFPNALNRNKILHGRELNYSSELNSFKAISLLSFIGTIVYDIEENR